MERGPDGERPGGENRAAANSDATGGETDSAQAALSDAEVTAIVDADLRAHDTLAAIEHLQGVLDARATASIPIVRAPRRDDTSGAPTQAISFDDLPVRREPEGPQPTYSAWVGAAVRPSTRERGEPGREPEPSLDSGPEPERSEPERPEPESDHPGRERRAEPLGLVPEEFAPRDSQPVPLVPLLPTAEPLVSRAIEPVDASGDDLDRDADDEAREDAGEDAPPPRVTPRIPDDETVLVGPPSGPPLFTLERADLESTPLEQRAGRASRLFWLWFAGTSSLISVGVGATLFGLGLSLRQVLVATLIGVAMSFLPLGLGTLAGKWSGQPTMVISRAVFGLRGNVLPVVIALIAKLFWGAVLLWLAGSAAGSLALAEGWTDDATLPTSLALAVTLLVAGTVAVFGYGLVARVQLVLTLTSAVLIAVMVVVTWRHIDVAEALAVPDAWWTNVVTGAVLVFSYLGLAWAMSSSEVARYQHPESSGAAGMLWATFGAAVPPFVLISYGGLLAASNPSAADDLASDPVGALERLGVPAWFAAPLLLAVVLSLISALVLLLYSCGFTLDALGVRLGRPRSTLLVAAAVGLAGGALAATGSELDVVIRGLPTALSVPVAAWAGLFAGETMLRTRRFHQQSLLRRGGVYPDWRWPNLGMLVVASVAGLGLVSSPLPWLAWEGYLFRVLGVDPQAGFGASNIGVAVALGLGLLTPILTGVPAVRRQEREDPGAARPPIG